MTTTNNSSRQNKASSHHQHHHQQRHQQQQPWAIFLLILAIGLYFHFGAMSSLSNHTNNHSAEILCDDHPKSNSILRSNNDNNNNNNGIIDGGDWKIPLQQPPEAAILTPAEPIIVVPETSSRTATTTTTDNNNNNEEDPVWWMDKKEDDHWFKGTYQYAPNQESITEWQSDEPVVRDVRHLQRKQGKKQLLKGTLKHHFHPMCGHYRFNTTTTAGGGGGGGIGMPTVSVIVTTQNEEPGWMSTTVHSILARTPPELLVEVLLIDDNGIPDEIRHNVHPDVEQEFLTLPQFSKVRILQNEQREGCARSRLVGARAATGQVLVFVDSHIEMMSATWYQHLVLPILDQPKTMSIQTIDVISDAGSRDYYIPGGPSYGTFDAKLRFSWLQQGFEGWGGPNHQKQQNSNNKFAEGPSHRLPYETPMGPGAMFAMRQEEFWRLGGYDEGLYVWGGENIELALKTWMCGGRIVTVPCSRAGHMFRTPPPSPKDKKKNKKNGPIIVKPRVDWPPKIPLEVANKTGCLFVPTTKNPTSAAAWAKKSNFSKIAERNDIRVFELWVGNHPARDAFYLKNHGTTAANLLPEWKQYVDEMRTDPAALRQLRLKKENQCKDFAWYDKHVLMKLVGQHHPWYDLPNK